MCGCGRIGFAALQAVAQDAAQDDGNRDYPTFTTCPTEFVLLGNAQCVGGAIELTSAGMDQAGAVWLGVPYPTNRSISVRATS
jgi:hypothetical protein